MAKQQKAYSSATVIGAQRRVLGMVADTLSRMSSDDLDVLRMCGDSGLITLSELSEHVAAALSLKVKSRVR